MPAKRERTAQIAVRVRPAARARALEEAARRRLQLGEYIELLIENDDPTRVDYFAQQAAFMSFMAANLTSFMVTRQLSKEDAAELRDRLAKLATQLFGQPPRRAFEVEGDLAEVGDPRFLALFEAFGVE